MDLWDREDVDPVAPGFIEFEPGHVGSLGFIAVQGGLDWRDAPRDGRPGVEFSWEGSDECDPVTGRGWAAAEEDGTPFVCVGVHYKLPRPGTASVTPGAGMWAN